MNKPDLPHLGKYAKSIGVDIWEIEDGVWLENRGNLCWDPTMVNGQAFELKVCMRAEVQYLEGKREVVISSNDGSIVFSAPYNNCVLFATRLLIVRLALELMKRRGDLWQ